MLKIDQIKDHCYNLYAPLLRYITYEILSNVAECKRRPSKKTASKFKHKIWLSPQKTPTDSRCLQGARVGPHKKSP